jgi:triacylglycerol lipase
MRLGVVSRRAFASALAAALILASPAASARIEKRLPIIFVHGNGDNAALWMTTIWRFESNGYPPGLLDAIDFRDPLATRVWDQPQAGFSTVAEETEQLAETVAAVRKRTHAAKVVLVAQSRGGNIVRNYLENDGGAAHTAIAVLCGAISHGVVISDKILVGSEFNGDSAFLRKLNAMPGEVVPGVRFMTIRSDKDDKYAQPDGRFIGKPGLATGIGYDASALKSAINVVIPGIDHRETGYGPAAFAAMYKFITGRPPALVGVRHEASVTLEGKVSAFGDGGAPTNIGVANAVVEIYQVLPQTGERMGNALLRQVTGKDGRWGPLKATPKAYFEFIVAVPGFPVTHIYRSPFLRSSRYVNFRPQLLAKSDREAGAVVYMSRPRGYFGVGRDRILLDGKLPPGVPPGVPSVSSAKLAFPAEPQRTVVAVFNHERIAVRTWPMKDDEVSVAEFTW